MRTTKQIAVLVTLAIASASTNAERYTCSVDGVNVEMDIPCSESPLTDTYKINQQFKRELKHGDQRAPNEPDAPVEEWRIASGTQANATAYYAERYLKRRLKDPDSYDRIGKSKVWTYGSLYFIGIQYKAKNSFGARTIDGHAFALDRTGHVVFNKQWNGKPLPIVFPEYFPPPGR